MVEDGLMKLEFAFLMKLQKAICEETLADRADLEELFWRDADLLFEVAEAIGDDALDAFAIGKDESETGGVHAAEVLFDESIKRFEDGFVRGGRALSERFERKKFGR
jgi:hypothetical protein